MTMENNSVSRMHQRETWLQECVAIFREAVLTRRAATGLPTPVCIEQVSMEFGIGHSRGKQFFYNELFSVTRETWISMKRAALRSCDTDLRLLGERLETRRARRLQYVLELRREGECGSGGGSGLDTASGNPTNTKTAPINGKSAQPTRS